MQQQASFPKKKKTKKGSMTMARKPPPTGIQRTGTTRAIGMSKSRPLTTAANKKFKRQRQAVNTISHDDENRNPNQLQSFGLNRQRKTNSQKRPQTAKPRQQPKSFLGGKNQALRKYNNYLPVNSTPSNRGAKPPRSKNYIVQQQSQMFTSFGLQGQSGNSQRKASSNPRKQRNINSIYGAIKPMQAGSMVAMKPKKQGSKTKANNIQ